MTTNPVLDLGGAPHARLRAVPISAVTLRDSFWEPRRRINREQTLASQFQKLEESGCFANFRRAAGQSGEGKFEGWVFTDSDLYKWLEAAATTLGTHPTPELEAMVESAIGLIEGAQQSDGYLNTYFMFDKEAKRWSNLRDDHEMYCIGHFIQAAVAHFRATGSRRLLDVAVKVADNLCDTFGPEEGKRLGTCGHPEIEMALVELFRATGTKRYLDEARFLVAMRGHTPSVCTNSPDEVRQQGGAYHQDHVPYARLNDVTGHAVRMLYLAAGAADIVLETGDEELRQAMDAQWHNMTTRRMYVSGGLGARYEGEAFGKDFELPNARAYTETCAAIASVMWNYRLLSLTADARYADLMEHTLYNAVLPGLSLDGHYYYYQNPLEDDGTHRRHAWFGCACCPPNVARTLAQLPGYFASVSPQNLWLHLYAQGTVNANLPDGQSVELEITTNYPWDGDVGIEVNSAGHFGLNLRIPGWCEAGGTLSVNGEPINDALTPSSYAEIFRDWKAGDTIRLHLPMPVRRLICHPHVPDNWGRVALQRGPILYAVEGADFPDTDLHDLLLPTENELVPTQFPDLLKGVVALTGTAQLQTQNPIWENALYQPASHLPTNALKEVEFRAIPYYAWANRSAGQMQVWLRSV